MSELKLVCWNMEWLNDLFKEDEKQGKTEKPPVFRADGDKAAHNKDATVRQRRDALSGVLKELDPDIVVIIEGPSRASELKLFFDTDLAPGTWETWLQDTPGSVQNVGIAVRTDTGKFESIPLTGFDAATRPELTGFDYDVDDDGIVEHYRFERWPLLVEIAPKGGMKFRVMGLHLKSKGIFGAYEWSKWWQVADANRRKILAQTSHLRFSFLDPHLTDASTKGIPIIVCGDINDGPGLDASEKRLYSSGIERLMGNVWRPELCLSNALFESLKPDDQKNLRFEKLATTRFSDPIFNDMYHEEWIDHILYSHRSKAWVSSGAVHAMMADKKPIWVKYKHASDHYPVSVKLTV
jgi:endonuclease/exonuclease/phosphatase family metal-dependent hydrolase